MSFLLSKNIPGASLRAASVASKGLCGMAAHVPKTVSLIHNILSARFSGFYTPYQDYVEVVRPQAATPPPPVSRPSAPAVGDEFEIKQQQILLLGAQQSGVEAVAYMLAQAGQSKVLQLSHDTMDSVMQTISRTDEPYILWSDSPDILVNGPLAELLPSPMILSIYIDYPGDALPPMQDLCLPAPTDMLGNQVATIKDTLSPSTSASANEHDSVYLFDKFFDYRIMVTPEDSPTLIFDRVNGRMMMSESYVSTRVFTSEENMMLQMHAEENNEEPDLVGFPQTYDQILDTKGGLFVPDMPSPYLLDKINMFKLNDEGELKGLTAQEALEKMDDDESESDGQQRSDSDGQDEDPADIHGSVIEPAFLPQTISRLQELTFEQRLQRVLESTPLGNIPPPRVAQALQQLFFRWDGPVAQLQPLSNKPALEKSAIMSQLANAVCVEVCHGPTGSHKDLSVGVANALLHAAVEHNNLLAEMHGMPVHKHRSVGFVSGEDLNTTLAALEHGNKDYPLFSMVQLNTSCRAVPSGLAPSEQAKVHIGHVQHNIVDLMLLLSQTKKNPQFVSGVKSGDYFSISTPGLAQHIARDIAADNNIRRNIHSHVGQFTLSTLDSIIPITTSALSAVFTSAYADMLTQQLVAPRPTYTENSVKKSLESQLGLHVRNELAGMYEDEGVDDTLAPEYKDNGEYEEKEQDGLLKQYKALRTVQPPIVAIPNQFPADSAQANSFWDFPLFSLKPEFTNDNLTVHNLTSAYQATCFDVALSSNNLDAVLAAIAARDMGMPIRKISIGFGENARVIFELLKYGVIRKPFSMTHSKFVTPQIIADLERILFVVSGRNQVLVNEMTAALKQHTEYAFERTDNGILGQGQHPVERTLERLNDVSYKRTNALLEKQRRVIVKDESKHANDSDASSVEEITVLACLDEYTMRGLEQLLHCENVAKRVQVQTLRTVLKEEGRLLDHSAALSLAGLRGLKRSIATEYIDPSNKRKKKPTLLEVPVPVLVPVLTHPERCAPEINDILGDRTRKVVSRTDSSTDMQALALAEIELMYSLARQGAPTKILPVRHNAIFTEIENMRIDQSELPTLPIQPENLSVIKDILTKYIVNSVGNRVSTKMDPTLLAEIALKAREDTARQTKEVTDRRIVNMTNGRKKMERKANTTETE